MTIIENLAMEHRVLLALFDQVESALTQLHTVEEIKFLAQLVKGLLYRHGEAERNMVYRALDSVLTDKGQLQRLNQEHQDMDRCLAQLSSAANAEDARKLLLDVVRAAREHFQDEETNAFPLIEAVLQEETLVSLAKAWEKEESRLVPTTSKRKSRQQQAIEEHLGSLKNPSSFFGGAVLTT